MSTVVSRFSLRTRDPSRPFEGLTSMYTVASARVACGRSDERRERVPRVAKTASGIFNVPLISYRSLE